MDKTLDAYTDEQGQLQPTPAAMRPGLCERTGGHVVPKPRIWPPLLHASAGQRDKGKTYAAVVCTRCQAHVIIYDPLPETVRWAEEPPPPKKAA